MAAGRPREFDPDAALDRAMAVFWRRGYEGATLPELTAAMGINRPSLYAAFGNKEALFLKALERYITGPAGYVQQAMAKSTAREAVEALFCGSIKLLSDPHNPGGCMVLNGSLTCGEAGEGVRKELCDVRAAGTDLIRQRLERAKQEGELPAATDCGDLARFVSAVVHGLGVQARGGTTRPQLQRVAQLALRAWPAAEK